MQLCPRCGEENPERFRLCGFCGAPLTQAAATAEARKTVTVVFCDLKGSTELGERVDAETLRELLGRYFESMRDILQRHGGTVEKYIGDAIMAVFGLPRLHEDDALRAVRAATEMRSALAELNAELDRRWGVRLTSRIGVNTGEVVAGDVVAGQRFATGDVVNVAARLEQAAPANEVLIGVATYRLVRETVDVEEVEALTLKGKSEPIPAYRLVAVRDTEWFSRRLEAPFVGREDELGELLVAFERATAARRLEVTTVLGHAGLGKTRLIAEFVGRVDTSAAILRGRCLSYGTGMTFWPIAEMVRGASGVTTSTGPSRPCSISSSTSRSRPARPPRSSCAARGTICSTTVPNGSTSERTRAASCSKRSAPRTAHASSRTSLDRPGFQSRHEIASSPRPTEIRSSSSSCCRCSSTTACCGAIRQARGARART